MPSLKDRDSERNKSEGAKTIWQECKWRTRDEKIQIVKKERKDGADGGEAESVC